jgi:hypothetical protein
MQSKVGPFIDNIPSCCTSAILHGFGEHDEPSEVTVEKIRKLVLSKAKPRYGVENDNTVLLENGKRCIFAISVNPANIRILKEAGFKVVDKYEGVQGLVHILTLHD